MTEECTASAKRSPILVIEDDPATRDAIKTLLQYDGYPVVTARHGGDALKKLRAGLAPCLILLDLVLPDMDGVQFRREQLADPDLAAIPVVIYSGRVDARHQADQLGAAGFFQKPLDLDSFLKLVTAHCHRYAPVSPKPGRASRHGTVPSAERGKNPNRGARESSTTGSST